MRVVYCASICQNEVSVSKPIFLKIHMITTETQLIGALKRLLKEQGKTYKDVAAWLSLSEGSVKRLFSKADMSIERMVAILDKLGCDMNDLVAAMNAESRQISQISIDNERALVEDIPAMLTALSVLSDLKFQEIVEHYGYDEPTIEKALLKLDKMKILTLLPNNHYQLNVHPNFRWQMGGPIQEFFMNTLASNFLGQKLEKGEELLLLAGMLGEESLQRLSWLIDDFTQRFQQLNIADRALPLAEKEATFVVLAQRKNWFSRVD